MAVTVNLPTDAERALKHKAEAAGLSAAGYAQLVLERDLGVLNAQDRPAADHPTGADLIAAMQASPFREIDLEPVRDRLPARDVTL